MILFCLLPCTVPGASQMPLNASERTVPAQDLAQAASLMEQGDTDEAHAIYARLAARYPDNDDLALARARAALAAGYAVEALPVYDRLTAKRPDNADLRLEAARAHLVMGNEDEAMRLGHETLAEYEKQRFQVHGAVRAGMLYDSNANQGPASSTISLGDWDGVRLPDAKRKDSLGAYAGANLDLGYRLSATSPWWLVGDVQGLWRGYGNNELRKIDSREWQWGRAGAGVRYLDGQDLVDLRVKAEVFDYELMSNVTALGAELRYIHAVTPWLHLISDTTLEQRTYTKSGYHNGAFCHTGGYARFFFGDDGHEFLIGAGFVGASAKWRDYGYDGWEGLARFSFKLPYGFTLSPQVSFTQEFYQGPATALETRKRQDDRLRIGADLSYAINESWSIEASYYYTDNSSTCKLYKYDQHLVSLGLAWKF